LRVRYTDALGQWHVLLERYAARRRLGDFLAPLGAHARERRLAVEHFDDDAIGGNDAVPFGAGRPVIAPRLASTSDRDDVEIDRRRSRVDRARMATAATAPITHHEGLPGVFG
jgi:hypothetical protein